MDGKGVLLESVPIGQEFVLDLEWYPGVFNWLQEIFDEAPTTSCC
jgi:hypothetical protein